MSAADTQTVDLDMSEVSTRLIEAGRAVQAGADAANTPGPALLEATGDDVTYAFLDTLRTHDVPSLQVEADALSSPQTTVPAILNAGHSEFQARGIPDPDLGLYRDALEVSQATGQDFQGVLNEMQAREPLAMRGDMAVPDSIAFQETPDTVQAVPEMEGPIAAAQQYDVHFMAYPLLYKEVGGVPVLDSQASHAFVVVTERGGDPLNEQDVLIARRAGPDNAGAQTMSSPDSSLPEDDQSETEKTNSGNVYVSSQAASIESDVNHPGAFHVETTTVTGNLTTMQALVDTHARYINGQDIDYELLNRNSNTYAGDVYEMLTGQEPPNFEWERMNIRYFPAVNRDLVDYDNTQFAPYMSDNHPGLAQEDYDHAAY